MTDAPAPGPASSPRSAQQQALLLWLRQSFGQRGRMLPWILGLLVLAGAVQTGAALWDAPSGNIKVLLAGGHVRDAVATGQWWRLFTWTLLHADMGHLLANLLMLAVVGRPVEAAFGAARLWIVFWGSALGAALAVLGHPGPWWTVGASGAVLGVLGAWVGLGLKLWPRLGSRMRVRMIALPAGALALLVWMGGASTDRLAHAGGALGGLLLGTALRPQFLPLSSAATRQSAAWLRWTAYAVAGVVLAAVALAAAHIDRPVPLHKVQTEKVFFDDMPLRVPAHLRRGTWSAAQGCAGALADPAWALRTRRVACFPLPVEGVLLLGRRDQLFTLDREDLVAMDEANRTGRWVRRQSGVLVAAVGRDWAWVVQAPEPLLPSYRNALSAVLPEPGSAVVTLPTAATGS
ncbi:MAG: rhomboid family intramembrane serine protease [Deltaproteobacteria bacterium]|nr:rhomboid family intramembrane serine protease [Deltaproteobacteria bacterium]